MSEKSPADVLEEAADLLLIGGRCIGHMRGEGGTRCALGALSDAAHFVDGSFCAAEDALEVHLLATVPWIDPALPLLPVAQWSDNTEDDFEVIDTLRHVAKDLRNAGAA